MKKQIIKILRENWSDREWDAHETYQDYKDDVVRTIIFDMLKNRNKSVKQSRQVAPIGRINKIWNDFSKTGIVRDEAGIDMVGEIFIKNIAMLAVNTELAGHTQHSPEALLKNYDDNLTPRQIKKILDDNGRLWKYIEDYNGHLTISDYGLPRLEKLAWKFLAEDKTYEEKLITLDMILNVVHQRSDLSRLFVQGGKVSLDQLFTNENMMKDLIKKRIDEALILKLDKDDNKLIVFSNEKDPKAASQETFRNKETLKANDFKWNGDIKAWVTPIENFERVKAVLGKINKSNEFIGKLEELEEFVKNSEDFNGKGNLMDKITMYTTDLANATDETVMSAEIRRYLTFFAKFRGHSFYNTMLIFIQNPKATRVAGFRQWEEKHHRRVVKGAKGIMIFAPVFSKKPGTPEPEANDSELDKEVKTGTPIRFRPVYVFDIADTEAIDERGEVPEQPKWHTEMEPTQKTEELYNYVKEVIEDMGITVTTDAAKGGENGYSSGNHINMSSAVKGAGQVSTLVHELAHELMHWRKTSLYYQGDEEKLTRQLAELQAESVSYVVMKHYDIPVQHHPTYIALWKGNKEKILQNLKVISDVAKFIIESIDTVAAQAQGQEKLDEDLYL